MITHLTRITNLITACIDDQNDNPSNVIDVEIPVGTDDATEIPTATPVTPVTQNLALEIINLNQEIQNINQTLETLNKKKQKESEIYNKKITYSTISSCCTGVIICSIPCCIPFQHSTIIGSSFLVTGAAIFKLGPNLKFYTRHKSNNKEIRAKENELEMLRNPIETREAQDETPPIILNQPIYS
ncbi:MAG: hypothetical protein CMP21_04885 [Rickettsiales bacterium]|nr:hypothetical protein [Rickettsiales bacterium]